ncbi:MAG TPA: hypothetical protein VLR90_16290 [Blastocatellia bacterium]|nr:hypothetical protein [Blastocatellia bacterium]
MENKTVENFESKTSEIDQRLQELEKRQNETNRQSKWPLRIAAISVFVSLLSLYVAYRYQSKQANFQEDQALVQMTLNLSNSWNETFSNENRLRFERFRAKLEDWENDPETRNNTLALLIDKKKVNKADLLKNDAGIMDLILLDLEAKDTADAISKPDYKIVETAYQYRNTIINCLNTMESIYTIKSYSKSEKTVSIIDAHHTEIIKIWVQALAPFISKYRDIYPETPQAWDILTNYKRRVD